mmetsp:Transcript_5600/g.7671  ORF Transcript_5600/g.7671 Transcript_5600/m.7671 type:complete len:216 (+) Transcript_5600:1995-2642(+)
MAVPSASITEEVDEGRDPLRDRRTEPIVFNIPGKTNESNANSSVHSRIARRTIVGRAFVFSKSHKAAISWRFAAFDTHSESAVTASVILSTFDKSSSLDAKSIGGGGWTLFGLAKLAAGALPFSDSCVSTAWLFSSVGTKFPSSSSGIVSSTAASGVRFSTDAEGGMDTSSSSRLLFPTAVGANSDESGSESALSSTSCCTFRASRYARTESNSS